MQPITAPISRDEPRDNRAAIALEREMGFTASAFPGDATLTLLRKELDPAR